jgi:hypothetical protein
MTQIKTNTMTAEQLTNGWTVIDEDGGQWWPSEEAIAQINSASNPEAEALRICEEDPMRGTWKQ